MATQTTPFLAVRVQMIRIPDDQGILKPSSPDWEDKICIPVVVKLSTFIAVSKDGEALSTEQLADIKNHLYPWAWTGRQWHGAVKDASSNWITTLDPSPISPPKIIVEKITTDAKKLLAIAEANADESLKKFKELHVKNYFESIAKTAQLNPSSSYCCWQDGNVFKRYRDAPVQTVHEAIESLGQLPPALAYTLEVIDYLVIGIDKGISLPDDLELFIALEFSITTAGDSLRYTLEKTPEDAGATPSRVWQYQSGTPLNAQANIVGLRKTFALAALDKDSGQLLDGNKLLISRQVARIDAQEVYSEDWIVLLPERLAGAYDPLTALLDLWRDPKTEEKIVNACKAIIPSLLRERAGTGIIARMNEAIPALDMVMDIADQNPDAAELIHGLHRVLATLATYELDTWQQTDNSNWLHALISIKDKFPVGNLCEFVASDSLTVEQRQALCDTINEIFGDKIKPPLTPEKLSFAKDSLEDAIASQYLNASDKLENFLDDVKAKMGNNYTLKTYKSQAVTFELVEKIVRLLKDEKFLALLIKQQWEDAATTEYSLKSDQAIPLCASLQWLEEPVNSSELQKPQLSGFIDLTDMDASASITLKGIDFGKIPDGEEFIIAIHCQAMSLEDFKGLLNNLPASTTTISFAKKAGSIEVTLSRNGSTIAEPLSFTPDDNAEFTLKLERKDSQASPPIKLIIKGQSDAKKFTYNSADARVIVSDEMWFSLSWKGNMESKLSIVKAMIPVRNASEAFLKKLDAPQQTEIDLSAAVDTIATARPYTLLAEPVLGPIWTIITDGIKGRNPSETGRNLMREQFEKLFKARIGKEGEIFAVPPIKCTLSDAELKPLVDAITKQAEPTVRRAFPLPENPADNKPFVPLSTTHNISLRIDQLIKFPKDDLWDDLLGSAFLLAYLYPDHDAQSPVCKANWFSLNTSKIVANDTAFVIDPMPLSAIESSGMRMAMMTFNNRNLVSAMPGDRSSSSNAPTTKIKKLITNEFPDDWRMPHLAYGAKVALAGYLCGQGGVLPEHLRNQHPAKLKKTSVADTANNPAIVGELTIDAQFVHVVDYLRRVPVGAPRLETRPSQLQRQAPLPIYPETVKPLAAELDRVAHRFMLKADEQRLFYRSFDLAAGVIDIADKQGIALDIMELEFKNAKGLIIELHKSEVIFSLYIVAGDKDNITIETIDLKPNFVKVILPNNDVNSPISLRFVHRYDSQGKSYTSVYFSKKAHTFFDGDAWNIDDDSQSAELQNVVELVSVEDAWLCVKPVIDSTDTTSSILLRPPLISIVEKSDIVDNDLNIQVNNVSSVFEEIAPAHIVMMVIPSKTKPETKLICKVRPPGLDFRTWAPAIITSPPTNKSDSWKLDDLIRNDLRDGNRLASTNSTLSKDMERDPALDDPYVDGLVIEVIPCFPSQDNQPKPLKFLPWPKPTGDFTYRHQQSGFPLSVTINPDNNPNSPTSIELKLTGKLPEGITLEKLSPGTVVEIRLYSATKAKLFDAQNIEGRKFDSRLAQGVLRFSEDGEEYVLSDPLKLRIEVPTRMLPAAKDIYELFSVSRDKQNATHARLVLNSNQLSADLRKKLRYCGIFRLPPQRWSWFGRPLPALGDVKMLMYPQEYDTDSWEQIAYAGRSDTRIGPTPSGKFSRELIPNSKNSSLKFQVGKLCDFVASDSLTDDQKTALWNAVNTILTKNDNPLPTHGNLDIAKSALIEALKNQQITMGKLLGDVKARMGNDYPLKTYKNDVRVLHRHNLDYQGTAAYWRFGLELESRYSGMSTDNFIVRAQNNKTRWKGLTLPAGALVRQQTDAKALIPSAPAQLQRPSIEIILPLTEALDFDGKSGDDWSVPPLLVIFNSSFYEHGNIADRLEVVLTAARHPLSSSDNTLDQYPDIYQEIGPDPILSATGHIPTTRVGDERASVVPVRIDGIIGFTQSPLTESSDQRRAAVLISIDDTASKFGQRWQQWPLAAVQLRRYHDPLLDDAETKTIFSPLVSGEQIKLETSDQGKVFYLKLKKIKGADTIYFIIMYTEVAEVAEGAEIKRHVTVSVTRDNNNYRISTTTTDENNKKYKAGDLVCDANDGGDQSQASTLILRIILTSQGNGKMNGLHISIAATTEQRINKAAELGYDPWLGATPIELDTGDGNVTYTIADVIDGQTPFLGSETLGANSFHTTMRITPFTAPVWCQFTPDTSRFRLTYKNKDSISPDIIKTIRTEGLKLELPNGEPPQLVPNTKFSNDNELVNHDLIKFEPMATFEGDSTANKHGDGKFLLFAAITKWIVDASGRPAEHYAGVVGINQDLSHGDLIFNKNAKQLFGKDGGGRIRILTVMYSPMEHSNLNGYFEFQVGNLCEFTASDSLTDDQKTALWKAINTILTKEDSPPLTHENLDVAKSSLIEALKSQQITIEKLLADVEANMGKDYPLKNLNAYEMLKSLFFYKTDNGMRSDAINRIVGVSRPIGFTINIQ